MLTWTKWRVKRGLLAHPYISYVFKYNSARDLLQFSRCKAPWLGLHRQPLYLNLVKLDRIIQQRLLVLIEKKDCLFLFKGGWSLLIRRFSINMTLKSLLLVARIEKSSKSGVWLQNKRSSLMAESSSPLTLPSECRNSQVFAHSDFKMMLSFAIIGSTAATTLKFVNKLETLYFIYYIYMYIVYTVMYCCQIVLDLEKLSNICNWLQKNTMNKKRINKNLPQERKSWPNLITFSGVHSK